MNRCRSCHCEEARCVDLPITAGARACCSTCDHTLPSLPPCFYCGAGMDDNRVLCAHSDHCANPACCQECPDCHRNVTDDLKTQDDFEATRDTL